MRKITDIISKPSQAIDAMVNGLRKQSQRPDFKVNMQTFGGTSLGICYGCAATCTIQELAETNIPPGFINSPRLRAQYLQWDLTELDRFECVIDDFRAGFPGSLFHFFKITVDFDGLPPATWFLKNDNWGSQLPLIEAYSRNTGDYTTPFCYEMIVEGADPHEWIPIGRPELVRYVKTKVMKQVGRIEGSIDTYCRQLETKFLASQINKVIR